MKIVNILTELTQNIVQNSLKNPQEISSTHPAHQHINQTFPTHNPTHPTHNPTHPAHFNKGNKQFSTGNEGVPTDRQTDQQTDNKPQKPLFLPFKIPKLIENKPDSIDDAARILDSLDSLKKEIRIKFKQLTDQEILVFSTLYQLEEGQGPVDYKTLAVKLSLTESSIRDYMRRLLKKGIPIEKKRINNKQILLSISENLKKVASLSTILQLRDI